MRQTDYALHFEDRGSYLLVRLAGLDGFAASLSYWNHIADDGPRKMLVPENLTGILRGRENST